MDHKKQPDPESQIKHNTMTPIRSVKTKSVAPINTVHNVRSAPKNCKIKKHNALQCTYTNVDTFMNKKDEFLTTITDRKPDIIGLTEIKPKNNRYTLLPEELKLEGYDSWYKLDGHGRGVVLYTKSDLKASPFQLAGEEKYEDSVWCSIGLGHQDKLILGCIYRSPNSTDVNNLNLKHLLKSLSDVRASHKVVMGDFNHPEIDWLKETSRAGPQHQATQFLESVRDAFLFQHVKEPTHYRALQTRNTLDLIFSNEANMIENMEYKAPIGKSHHTVLHFNINYVPIRSNMKKEVYCYDKGNYEEIRHQLNELNWSTMFENQSTENRWNIFIKHLSSIVKNNIPIRILGGQSHDNKPPWMTKMALQRTKEKHEAFKDYKNRRDEESYKHYCKKRNQSRKSSRTAIKEFEQKIAKELKSNPKSFYKYVKSKTKVQLSSPELEINGSIKTTSYDKAEALNNFFTSVFTNEDTTKIPCVTTNSPKECLSEFSITKDEVKKLLDKLNINKSAGSDGIHPRVLREAAKEISTPLFLIFSKSIQEGLVPSAWKEATITPLHKKGSKKVPGNYRPVSLTSIGCKLMEQLVRHNIIEHLEKTNCLTPHQHGFVKGKSCTTQLLSVIEHWSYLLDNKKSIDNVYFHFQKTQHSSSHKITPEIAALWHNWKSIKVDRIISIIQETESQGRWDLLRLE